MNLQDIKIYAINFFSLAISMTHVEMVLKLILLVASIVYTAQRIWINYNEKKNRTTRCFNAGCSTGIN